MSSDSSDDEENLKLLREAADHQFINDSMFNCDNQKKKGANTVLPSLRPSKQDDQFNILGVTPEFQAHVARRLAANLEKRLKHALPPDVGVNLLRLLRTSHLWLPGPLGLISWAPPSLSCRKISAVTVTFTAITPPSVRCPDLDSPYRCW